MSCKRRKQPIRDAILAFLSQPRSAKAVAGHIGRPVPTATGHLAAMRRRGLVLRLGYAAYAAASYSGPPVSFRGKRDHADRDAILACLIEPRRVCMIAAHIGIPTRNVEYHLSVLRSRGAVLRLGTGIYASAAAVPPGPESVGRVGKSSSERMPSRLGPARSAVG